MVRMMKRIVRLIIIFILVTAWGIPAQQQITFKLKAAPNTSSVHVVGDFNNWSKRANPMSDFDGDRTWETTLTLEPGSYQYRFLLDGVQWIKDPMNPYWTGEFSNSVLRIKNSKEPELRNIKPEMGTMIRTSKLKIEADYIDGIGKHGLDIQDTKVLVNQEPQKFFYNTKLNKIECYLDTIEDGEYSLEIHARDLAGNDTQLISSFFIVNSDNQAPISDAGHTIIGTVNAMVQLNSGVSYDPDKDQLQKYNWKMIARPAGSGAKLENDNSAFPAFKPDKIGRYLFTLRVNDGDLWSEHDSVDVFAIIRREYPLEFNLSDSVFKTTYETSIEEASVAGEFNNWSATANPMKDFDRDGNWTAWVNLDPGEYEYKFVVNGKHWIADPSNPARVSDGWNGFNSIVSASLNLAPIVEVNATFGPGKIIFDASESSSQMGRELTYSWFQDIKNPQRFDLPAQKKISFPVPKQHGIYYFYLIVTDSYEVSSQKTLVLNVDKGIVKVRDFSDSPDWAKDAIIYEVFLRKFTPEGNLKSLIDKIPYLKTLGVNCIWLMPVWDGPTSHGYGPTNFFAVEQDYGTLDDFKIFVEKAHQAGIRVILDFIANHTSDQHSYFLSAYKNPISPFRDWYRWHSESQGDRYYRYDFHNDWDTLPNLNYENPGVRKYIIDAATFWAELGVDGFRCDVAWGVPHDFWKRFRRSLKTSNPDFLLINEVLPRSPKYHNDEFDMSYDTDFYGNLLDVMNGRKPLSAIDYGLKKTQKNYPNFALDFRYLENHDMDRFISQFGEPKTKLAATLLLTIPGAPLIYYGQEIGLHEKTPRMDWDRQNDSLAAFYKTVIRLRRQHTALRRGEMIKVLTDSDDRVYAYLRFDARETFLVILNFSKQIEDCQVLFPKQMPDAGLNKRLLLEEVITSQKTTIDLSEDRRFQMKLAPESPAIFRLIR